MLGSPRERPLQRAQSRYGNLFTVREIGESAAVVNMLEALTGCLRQGGCAVVPGLPPGQYFLTLYCAIAGGFVAGFASTLQPEGAQACARQGLCAAACGCRSRVCSRAARRTL